MSTLFGDFLRKKRKERHFTIRKLSNLIGKSISYISQLESGLRPAPKTSGLKKISDALVLNDAEKEELFDLADKSRNSISDDLTLYINSHNEVKETIRFSKNLDIPDGEWEEFLKKLKDRFVI